MIDKTAANAQKINFAIHLAEKLSPLGGKDKVVDADEFKKFFQILPYLTGEEKVENETKNRQKEINYVLRDLEPIEGSYTNPHHKGKEFKVTSENKKQILKDIKSLFSNKDGTFSQRAFEEVAKQNNDRRGAGMNIGEDKQWLSQKDLQNFSR
jgi:hypothetical protein